jgi:hypothetical protein
VVTYRISGWQRVPIWYTMSREGPFEKDWPLHEKKESVKDIMRQARVWRPEAGASDVGRTQRKPMWPSVGSNFGVCDH